MGSIMPNFDGTDSQLQANRSTNGLRAGTSVGDSPTFTVSIDNAPTSAASGQALQISGRTTGFSAGNWINAWVRLPDGSQLDDGGLIANGDQFTLPMTLVQPGVNQIQFSAGAWPAEQWSQAVTVNVSADQLPLSDTGVGVAYHNLSGRVVLIMAARPAHLSMGQPRFDILRFDPWGHDGAQGTLTNGVLTGIDYPQPSEEGLYTLSPNSTDFNAGVAYSR